MFEMWSVNSNMSLTLYVLLELLISAVYNVNAQHCISSICDRLLKGCEKHTTGNYDVHPDYPTESAMVINE